MKEYEALKLEREKLIKQAKTNKKIKVDDSIIDEKKCLCLSNEIMVELLKNMLTAKDCSVGCIIEDFNNKYVENEKIFIRNSR